jgi:hypothetical protein
MRVQRQFLYMLVAAYTCSTPAAAQGQNLQLPVVPGVPGQVDSELNALICLEWDQAAPFPIGCPPDSATTPALSGCVNVDVVGEPASAMTLNDFEVVYDEMPEQTATFFSQGTVSFIITETTIRLAPGAGPIVGVYDSGNDVFNLSDIDIEIEGQIIVTGTAGDAGDAFPVSMMDLSAFTFPLATGVLGITTETPDGSPAVVLSILLGAPFFEPGGRLDVGSGFVVGFGGGALMPSYGDSCAGTTCTADTNGDGSLTPTDFTAWINAFNNNLPECDQNNDGSCTPTDFTAWIANFNAGC